MELDNGFKDRIKWAINIKDSNQSELARAIGSSPQAIQQWVSGATRSPRRDHVLKAADFLGVRHEWLAYSRGPMKSVTGDSTNHTSVIAPAAHAEDVVHAHDWEQQLIAALPEDARCHWQQSIPHPGGVGAIRVDWVSDRALASLGLYKSVDTLVASSRQRVLLLAIAREILPPVPGRRTVLLLAPLDSWRETPTRHLEALRAEARMLHIDVEHVTTPVQCAAVLLCHESETPPALTDDLGLDVPTIL